MLGIALRRIYPKASLTMINAGVSGNNTRAALARIDKDVLAHRPQLVTVMFCLNDIVGVPLDEFKANIIKIVHQCRDAGAEVLLCTTNGVFDTPGRPIAKIVQYHSALKQVGDAEKVPIADCYATYEAIQEKNPQDFPLLMSDEIHPNMAGHKLNAERIALAISGKAVSLANVGPLCRPFLRQWPPSNRQGPYDSCNAPFDGLIGPALTQLNPQLNVKVISWPTAGQSLAEIETAAKKVREMKVDAVFIAIPASARAESKKEYHDPIPGS